MNLARSIFCLAVAFAIGGSPALAQDQAAPKPETQEQTIPGYQDSIDCAGILTIMEYSARESKTAEHQKIADEYEARAGGWLIHAGVLEGNSEAQRSSDHLAAFKVWIDRIKANDRKSISAMVHPAMTKCGKWEKADPPILKIN